VRNAAVVIATSVAGRPDPRLQTRDAAALLPPLYVYSIRFISPARRGSYGRMGELMLDHGYDVNEDKRCEATTKKQRRCTLPPISGIDRCALHSGLARPRSDAGYGGRKALDEYKRRLVQASTSARPGARPIAGR
jgi:hypothetical protein